MKLNLIKMSLTTGILTLLTSTQAFSNDVQIVQNTCDVEGSTRCYEAGLKSILNGRSTLNTIVAVAPFGGETNHKSVKEVYLDAAAAANQETIDVVSMAANDCENAIKSGEIEVLINNESTMAKCMKEALRD